MKIAARTMQQFDHHFHSGGANHPWLWVIFFAAVGIAIVALVWLIVRGARSAPYPAAMGPPPDPAMDTLRMRFATGEIDADDYAARAAQLSGWVPPVPEPPIPPPV